MWFVSNSTFILIYCTPFSLSVVSVSHVASVVSLGSLHSPHRVTWLPGMPLVICRGGGGYLDGGDWTICLFTQGRDSRPLRRGVLGCFVLSHKYTEHVYSFIQSNLFHFSGDLGFNIIVLCSHWWMDMFHDYLADSLVGLNIFYFQRKWIRQS